MKKKKKIEVEEQYEITFKGFLYSIGILPEAADIIMTELQSHFYCHKNHNAIVFMENPAGEFTKVEYNVEEGKKK